MATKFETKSAIIGLVSEISTRYLRITGGFWGRAIEWCQPNFTTTDPRCYGNEIRHKIGYNSACRKDIREIFVYIRRFFWVVLLNDARQILPRPTHVAMATKFETKSAITQLVYEISKRYLRPTRGFGVGLLNDVRQILPRLTLVAMTTKFEAITHWNIKTRSIMM